MVLARDKETGDNYALKFIERGHKITHHVEREILNHKKLNHPHVIELMVLIIIILILTLMLK